jgi:4-hydroxymandelate oxidase
MTQQEIWARAREVLSPRCRVCPECDGVACAGQAPGPGGKGRGRTFQRNVRFLRDRVKLHLDVLGGCAEPDTGLTLLGRQLAAPIFAAPIGMVALNWSDALNEESYAEAVVSGTLEAGTLAFTGGGASPESFFAPLEVLRRHSGQGIPTLKPWRLELALERLALVAEAGCPAFAMDIDSGGLPHAAGAPEPVAPKTPEDLEQLAKASPLPFLVKGIMTAESARLAAGAGVYGIIVSNHGGRVLDDGLSTAEVLPKIRQAVGSAVKILVDGGVRSGGDVFKMLALGADAVLIGRPYSIAAYGGGAEGVCVYTRQLISELRSAMAMTGCRSLADIDSRRIRLV